MHHAGATIGQLDPDSLFYLRARGISLEAARSMLIYAFASEVVNQVKVEPLRSPSTSTCSSGFRWESGQRSLLTLERERER